MERMEFIERASVEADGEKKAVRVFDSYNFDDLDGLNSRVFEGFRAWFDQKAHLQEAHHFAQVRVRVQEWRESFEKILVMHLKEPERALLGGLEVHQRLVKGLPGISLGLAGSLAHETIEDLTDFFGMTAKTFRGRLKQEHLGLDESERVLRSARVTLAASELFGGFDQAREYLRTKNFALGGAKPIDLIQTAEGERLVLDELHAQAHSAPL